LIAVRGATAQGWRARSGVSRLPHRRPRPWSPSAVPPCSRTAFCAPKQWSS